MNDTGWLTSLVEKYQRKEPHEHRDEMRRFREMPSLTAAIEGAAASRRENGRKYSHQGRISPRDLDELGTRLLAVQHRIESCPSFDALYDLVALNARPMWKDAKLVVYDVSQRIGAYHQLSLYPTVVYLQRGAEDGARNLGLWAKGRRRDGRGCRTLTTDELRDELKSLPPSEVEDFLCIYKDCFERR